MVSVRCCKTISALPNEAVKKQETHKGALASATARFLQMPGVICKVIASDDLQRIKDEPAPVCV